MTLVMSFKMIKKKHLENGQSPEIPHLILLYFFFSYYIILEYDINKEVSEL